MSQTKYEDLLLQRAHAKRRWENRVAKGYNLDDLDADEILATVQSASQAGRIAGSLSNNPQRILGRFGLWVGSELTQAAIVLFGKRLLPDYPQCSIRLARFKGTTKSEFLDNKQFNGHTFQLLMEAELFLNRHLPVAGKIEPGYLERKDRPLFPPDALREALINAICHRDYSDPGGSVSVAIFDDRLEIWSTGRLPFGLTVDDLKRDHESLPRNPLIAEVFYRRGLIERWGRGTQRIIELCQEARCPEPYFEERGGSLCITFPMPAIIPRVSLSQRQMKIVERIRTVGSIANRDVREMFGLSNRAAANELARLVDLGVIKVIGRGRSFRYILS